MPLWTYLEQGGKRAIEVAHRRWGKDDVALHWTATAAHERIGTYWHLLPQASQARKAIWEAVNPRTARRRIDDAFPQELRSVTRENEMFIRFKCGSTWQVVGSDNYDSLVGSPPIGVVFSEWALANPHAWAYLRPILRENGGWALFIYTPRGRNHGATFYEGHKDDANWFCEMLSAEKTPVFTKEALELERSEYVKEYGRDDGENRYRQEYLCDFNAAVVGAYYGRLMNEAETEGRIGVVPRDGSALVNTAWDLGIDDSTAIWFWQQVGLQVRILDYYQASGQPLAHYAALIKSKPYSYGEHVLPHDAGADRWEKHQVTTISKMLAELEIQNRVLPMDDVEPGIEAVRRLLPQCWFDRKNCERGIEALRNYRREWDDEARVFRSKPLHDWSSDGADAFRYLARGLKPPRGKLEPIKYPKRGGVL